MASPQLRLGHDIDDWAWLPTASLSHLGQGVSVMHIGGQIPTGIHVVFFITHFSLLVHPLPTHTFFQSPFFVC